MAMKWLTTYCQNARYFVKADDDVLIDIFSLMAVLNRQVTSAKRSFFCWVWPRNPVIRQGNWKWVVNTKQFSSSYYPPYCNGPAWIVTRDIIPELSNATTMVDFMPIEDVYTSGLLPRAIGGVSHIHEVAGIITEPHGTPLDSFTNYTIPAPLFSVPREHEYPTAWNTIIARLRDADLKLLTTDYLKIIL